MARKIFILGFTMLLSVASAFAQGGTTGPLTWNIDNNGTLTISGTGAMPDYEWDYEHAAPWQNFVVLISAVVIENGVTTIGNNAFNDCFVVKSITIGNSVTSIGKYAFAYCFGTYGISASVTIPSSVTTIGDRAFFACAELESIIIPNSVTSIGWGAFSSCGKLSSVTIPNSITTIEEGTFDYSGLESITIPNSVTTIGVSAFQGCHKLSSVIIPNSVTTIGSSAFSECIALESITLPNSVTSFGDGTFDGCTALKYITIPNSATTIGSSAFSECIALESITIPNSVTKIRPNVFTGCTALTSITVLNLVPIDIGHEVFYGWGGQGIDSVDIATITLKVPTSAVSSYQTAEVWKEMIIEGGGILVNPVTNNPEQGYTTGDGLYGGRATATVTAVPRNGYRFVNWTIDGAVISTANPYSFTVTEDVELVANFNESVGIVETARAPSLRIYPNPTKDELRIENGELKINNVEIYDVYGKKQFSTFNYQLSTINVSHFPTGIYFIKIETDKGIVTKKFIKN